MKTSSSVKGTVSGLLAIMFLASACQTKKTTSDRAIDAAHNSRNSVDWSGTYQGTLPCADCPGIRYNLTLNEDSSYQLQTQYLDKGDSVFTDSGTFTWNDAGSQITLPERDEKFQVGEGRLLHLDMEGKRITGELAEQYVLNKVTETITGRYWKLIEVGGKAVEAGSTQKEPFIRLNSAENRLEATGGCNGLGGTYELQEPNRVKFSQLIGTMMACENMEVENGLKRALESADSYHVQGDTLQLFRARMAPLAKFIAVAK
ncbi:copper resistance protein NlpE N-terminal domain-containing protein [Parapedobacter sp. DT-150]|uniref:copper resistance protein NlpE N-terminal domain-containing protein n=1 Tax=Parapedobacter sp. DT-150 TaxID=3396162 RepID=UPI003F1A8589